jgi:mannose/fructose/N-acetylgalactosamine-specific phosphotransferase system component IIC
VTVELLLVLLIAGLAAVDATPFAQTLASQPLVTATVLGAVFGDWRTALEVGVVLQILSASTLPIGARTPEDYAGGGVIGVTIALLLAQGPPYAMVRDSAAMLGVLAGLVAATLGVPLVKWQRRRNEALGRWAEAELRAGHEGALAAAHRAGIVFAFAVGVSYAAACIALGTLALGPVVEHQSLRLSRAWGIAHPLWIGLGLAQLLHAFVQRRLARALLFGGVLLASWLLLMVGGP